MNSTRHRLYGTRACLECQRRKTRCVLNGDSRVCSYCSKASKTCLFDKPPSRTPLTRKNLDAVEARCEELERLLRRHRAHRRGASTEPGLADYLVTPGPNNPIETPAELGLEWRETSSLGDDEDCSVTNSIQDGMVFRAASGYVGNSSGSRLFESISPMLSPDQRMSAEDDPRRNGHLSDQSLQSANFTLQQRLSTFLSQKQLIDAYFIAYNSFYPIIHERSFREQCRQRSRISTQSHWHLLYYAVLAVGEWVSGSCVDNHSVYYEAARSRIRPEILESGSIIIVQAMLLLGNYLQKRDRPNTGYNFVGIAYRMALGLGLHREVSSMSKSSFSLQRRRLLFWAIYSCDSGFSITTGRPLLTADSFNDVSKPKNIDDSQYLFSADPPEADYPTSCSAAIAQARLAVIANKVYGLLFSTQPCANVDHSVAILEHQIENWRTSLPAFFFDDNAPNWFLGPRQSVFWREANLRILLLLASQRQHTEEYDKKAIGTKYQVVAAETILDIANFCQMHADVVHIGVSWYAVYFLLQAVLALCAQQLREKASPNHLPPSQASNGALANGTVLVTAHQCLENLGAFDKVAKRALGILDRLCSSMRNGVTSPSLAENSSTGPVPAETTGTNVAGVAVDHTAFVGFDVDQRSVPPVTARVLDSSSDDVIASDFIDGEQVGTADPLLQMFLGDVGNVDYLFQSLRGFPTTLETDNFPYSTSSINTVGMTLPSQAPGNNAENGVGEPDRECR